MGKSKLLALVGTFAIAGLSACSSSTTVQNTGGGGGPGTPQDPGVTPGNGQEPGAGTEKNPYGVAYPTQNIGYQARKGNTPGNLIKNYKFLGYRNGDSTKPLETLSLAEFFDPEMKQFKLIHFSAAALWCNPCNQETAATVPLIAGMKDKKVLFLQALTDGNVQGKGATPADLVTWVKRHNVNFNVFLDPEVKNLGQFFDAAAIPWNANIDARSMEILTAGVGYNPKITEEIDTWLSWVDSNPAQKVQ